MAWVPQEVQLLKDIFLLGPDFMIELIPLYLNRYISTDYISLRQDLNISLE